MTISKWIFIAYVIKTVFFLAILSLLTGCQDTTVNNQLLIKCFDSKNKVVKQRVVDQTTSVRFIIWNKSSIEKCIVTPYP